jgi:hypothetical protein
MMKLPLIELLSLLVKDLLEGAIVNSDGDDDNDVDENVDGDENPSTVGVTVMDDSGDADSWYVKMTEEPPLRRLLLLDSEYRYLGPLMNDTVLQQLVETCCLVSAVSYGPLCTPSIVTTTQ